jgi:hypothetical protein
LYAIYLNSVILQCQQLSARSSNKSSLTGFALGVYRFRGNLLIFSCSCGQFHCRSRS